MSDDDERRHTAKIKAIRETTTYGIVAPRARPEAPPIYSRRESPTLVPCCCLCSHCNRADKYCTTCDGAGMTTAEKRSAWLASVGASE